MGLITSGKKLMFFVMFFVCVFSCLFVSRIITQSVENEFRGILFDGGYDTWNSYSALVHSVYAI